MIESKTDLRNYCKQIWQIFLSDQEKINKLLENLHIYLNNNDPEKQKIFAFFPTKDEPPFLEILINQYNKIFLPVIESYKEYTMNFYLYKNGSFFEKLNINSYGIFEPEKQQIGVPENTIVILPSLGINKYFVRLGKGKGYYDRYFYKKNFSNVLKISLLPEKLTKLDFAKEEFDLVLDWIITEEKILMNNLYGN